MIALCFTVLDAEKAKALRREAHSAAWQRLQEPTPAPPEAEQARYDLGWSAGVRLAKPHLRYAVHRTNERGERQYREGWNRAGRLDKATAYERLDGAGPQDYVYRLTLSPPPPQDPPGTLAQASLPH